MSSVAVLMLIVSIALIWGGLGIALVHLSRNPDDPAPSDEEAETLVPWSKEA